MISSPIVFVVIIVAIVVIAVTVKKHKQLQEEARRKREKEEEENRRIAEENNRIEQEKKEKYKQDISSGRISYEAELTKIVTAIEEYRQNSLEVVDLWKRYCATLRTGSPESRLLGEMSRRKPEYLRPTLREAKLLNEIRWSSHLNSLIEDGEKIERSFNSFWCTVSSQVEKYAR